MRIEIIEKKVYSFEDLAQNEELKKNVLAKHQDINIDSCIWYECIIEDQKERLNNLGFLDSEIFFSGFCSQGDGACFECKSFDIDKLLISTNFTEKQKKIIKKVDDLGCLEMTISKNNYGYHYSHEKTRYFTAYFTGEHKRIQALISDFDKQIEQLRLNASGEIYSKLDQQYYFLQEEKQILETLECNEYEFNIDGSIY